MESLRKQIRGIITRECVAKGIKLPHINVGCDHAEHLLDQGETARYSVKEGIVIAQGQQRLANYRERATLTEVA